MFNARSLLRQLSASILTAFVTMVCCCHGCHHHLCCRSPPSWSSKRITNAPGLKHSIKISDLGFISLQALQPLKSSLAQSQVTALFFAQYHSNSSQGSQVLKGNTGDITICNHNEDKRWLLNCNAMLPAVEMESTI